MTTRPLINSECFIVRPGNWENHYTRARVVKVTTGGQISVLTANSEEPKRFTEHGDEIGKSGSRFQSRLEFDVAGVEKILADRAERRRVDSAVRELIEKINSHKNGFGSYHFDGPAKDELEAAVRNIFQTPEPAPAE